MREPILKTKLMRPRISSHAIYRERLVELLQSNLDKKMIILCADAGYGKTTLLVQLVNRCKIPHVWYQIDRSDRDFALFMRYLVEGVRRFSPGFGKRTLTIVDRGGEKDVSIEMVMGTFINELIELRSDRMIFIFDDFYRTGKTSGVISGIEYLLHYLPPNVSIIISTRETPGLSIGEFYVKNEILEIDREDLKFDDDEIMRLYQRLSGNKPNREEVEQLKADSEGWITYLQFLIQPSQRRTTISVKGRTSLINRLHTYFYNEIFEPLESDLKHFLVATSIFEYLSPESCDFILSRNNSHRILHELKRRHLFIGEYDETQSVYCFHHLFRDFLVDMLRKSDLYQHYHARAGLFWKKKMIFSEAIPHYLEAKKFEAVSALIKRFGEDYLRTGNIEFMRSCMQQLPKAIIDMSPNLLRILGRIRVFDCDWGMAEMYFKKAKQLAMQQKNYDDAFQTIHNHYVMKIDQGKCAGVIKGLKRVLNSKRLKKSSLRMKFLSSLGAAYSFEGKTEQAIGVYDETLKLAKRIKDDFYINTVLNNLGVLNLDMGNFEDAQHYFETIKDKLCSNATPLLIPVLGNLGNVLMRKGHLVEAEAFSKEAQKYARLFNDRRKLCANLYNLGIIKLNRGDLKNAKKLLQEAETLSLEIGSKAMLCSIWRGMAELSLYQGDLHEARQYIDKVFQVPLPVLYQVPFLITKAEIALALKELGVAQDALRDALPKAKELKHQLMKLHILYGRLCLQKNNKTKAKEFISKAFSAAKKYSYDYLLLHEIRFLPEVIRFAEEMRIEPNYYQHLLSQSPYPDIVETIIEPKITDHDFVVQLLGNVQIFINGELYKKPWRAKKFKELFCFLIAHRATVMTRDKITCAFWPDHSITTARQLFHNALNWLRKNFCKDIIVFDAGGYSLSPRYRYWVDIEEVERFIKEGDAYVHKGNITKGLLSYERVVMFYRGGFMDDFYTGWCQEKREYYNRAYLDVLKKLISNYYHIGYFEKALEFYHVSLGRHICDEEIVCIAMWCYAALGDHRALKSCFSHLENILAKDFKTTPNPTTIKLFNTLIREFKSS